jgi:hypothetical protein
VLEVGTHYNPEGMQSWCYRVGMWPERVKEDFKSETVQHVLWSYLHAFSFDEIHNETEEKYSKQKHG